MGWVGWGGRGGHIILVIGIIIIISSSSRSCRCCCCGQTITLTPTILHIFTTTIPCLTMQSTPHILPIIDYHFYILLTIDHIIDHIVDYPIPLYYGPPPHRWHKTPSLRLDGVDRWYWLYSLCEPCVVLHCHSASLFSKHGIAQQSRPCIAYVGGFDDV